VYVEKDIEQLRKSGLRSAYEVLDLWLDLDVPEKKATALDVITQTATAMNRPTVLLNNILTQVALDPYTEFLYLSWSGLTAEDFNDEQRRTLDVTIPDSQRSLSATDSTTAKK
jgi:hypothetical protein